MVGIDYSVSIAIYGLVLKIGPYIDAVPYV